MAKGKQQKRERVEKTESPMSKKTKKTVEETEQLVSSKEEKETVVKKESPGASKKGKKTESDSSECSFAGEPIPAEEARRRWPERYRKKESVKNLTSSGSKKGDEDEEVILKAKCHYSQAEVDGCIYNLYDDAYVKGEEGKPNYICRIVEFFKGLDNKLYFTARWFYRAEDTVIRSQANLHDPRRVFLSDIKDANTLDCIVSKVHILQVSPYVDLQEKEKTIPPCDFYYDMSYSVEYSTFANLPSENVRAGSDTSSTISSEAVVDGNAPDTKSGSEESCVGNALEKSEMTLLDLYSGCGGMSTGLCHGANLSGVNLVTRWAVDMNEYACKSMKWNHPETEVRNESAEDFLDLLKEWEKLCKKFSLVGSKKSQTQTSEAIFDDEIEGEGDESKVSPDEFEVGKFVGICFGETDNISKRGLKFKVRWKGYGPSDDTWEPVEGLSKCKERIYEFVKSGYKASILPLPGDVDVVCGGPPCQGISGFNRFRNREDPLADPKNHQLVVFMDIVNFLKPKYVLMENVVDILKFEGGLLGRYALCRLVSMNYQARLGMMAAGCYGVAQYRMRVFLWGARPTEKLPPYPLPTHNVINRGYTTCEFERNTVAYEEDQERQLEEALLLGDCISDLPPVENDESRDEMPYGKGPTTDFERLIRSGRDEYVDSSDSGGKTSQKEILYDHRPLCLNDDDYQRVCRIPKRKKANFRDLPGVLVGPDKKVQWDPNVPREYLSSGKPLIPDYAMTFVRGTSSKPFGRLWYDEIVPTVVTRAEPHNQVILHPEQDRVLTVRENARLQGFPDCYKLFGSIKERYIQVGNAVAVPVSRALGYALGLASKGLTSNEPLMKLPQKFPHGLRRVMSVAMEIAEDNV